MNAPCALNWIQYFASAASEKATAATTANCKQQSFLCPVDSCSFFRFLFFFMAIAHFMAFFFRAEIDFSFYLHYFSSLRFRLTIASSVYLFARGVKGVEWVCATNWVVFQLPVPAISQNIESFTCNDREREEENAELVEN